MGLTVLIATIIGLAAAPASAQTRWEYADSKWDARKVINVLETSLDVRVKGMYRIRVEGKEFIKNRTDIVRIYFDTRGKNTGPEYRLTWYLGKNPARRVGTTYFSKVDSWEADGRKVRCPGIKHFVRFGVDRITLTVPKRCMRRPNHVRWAGFVGEITRATEDRIYGYFDEFPRRFRFKNWWAD